MKTRPLTKIDIQRILILKNKEFGGLEMLQPIGNRITVERCEAETTLASGIIIPDSKKEKPMMGVVLSTSDSITESVTVGDKVLFSKYAGTEFSDDQQRDLVILSCTDILGLLTE